MLGVGIDSLLLGCFLGSCLAAGLRLVPLYCKSDCAANLLHLCVLEDVVVIGQHAPRRSFMVTGDDCQDTETSYATAMHSPKPTQQHAGQAEVRFSQPDSCIPATMQAR